MDKCYRVTFYAKLLKLALAFKAACEIDVLWKRGQKSAQSQKISFANAEGVFSETLSINCNVGYDEKTKSFKPKITKFAIVLHMQKGTKQAGQIQFDVSLYLNEKTGKPKQYELPLQKCPDKNAKLIFDLAATVGEEVLPENLDTTLETVGSMIPTNDKMQSEKNKVKFVDAGQSSMPDDPVEQTKYLQRENRRMKEQLKGKEKLQQENLELRRKIKNDQYDSVKVPLHFLQEMKAKIDAGKKQVEKMQHMLDKEPAVEKELKALQEQVFKCKLQLMNSFNYVNEIGGSKLLNAVQQACGLKE